MDEAKQFYPLFGLGANVALIFSGRAVKYFSQVTQELPALGSLHSASMLVVCVEPAAQSQVVCTECLVFMPAAPSIIPDLCSLTACLLPRFVLQTAVVTQPTRTCLASPLSLRSPLSMQQAGAGTRPDAASICASPAGQECCRQLL